MSASRPQGAGVNDAEGRQSYWDLTNDHPNEYADWQEERQAGETTLGFRNWLLARS